MGQINSFPTPNKALLEFTCLPKEGIQSLWLSYNLHGEGWSVNLDQFIAIFSNAKFLHDNYKFSEDMLRSLFKMFDTDSNGLIDVLEMVIALALVSGMDLVEKVQFAFSVYDMSSLGLLTHDETHLLFRSTARGLSKISTCEGFSSASINDAEMLSSLLFASVSKNTFTDKVDREQFREYVLSNPVIRNWLSAASNLNIPSITSSLGLITPDDKLNWGKAMEQQMITRKSPSAISHVVLQSEIEAVIEDVDDLNTVSQLDDQPLDQTMRVVDEEEQNNAAAAAAAAAVAAAFDASKLSSWRVQAARLRPEELPALRNDVPEDTIESQWIGSINARRSCAASAVSQARAGEWMQRSARYHNERNDSIIYSSAAHVLIVKKNEESGQWSQKSYCEHSYPISAFDLNYAKNILATVDASAQQQKPLVDARGKTVGHRLVLWELSTMKVQHRFEFDVGIQSVDINSLGTLAVITLMDLNCTMNIIDLSTGLSVFSTQLLTERHGDRVNDVRFEGTSTIVAVAYEKQGVRFFVDEQTGVMGKHNMHLYESRDAFYGNLKSLLPVVSATTLCRLDHVDELAVGTSSGHLLIFKGRTLTQVIEGHRERITSVEFDPVSKTLISGCAQGSVRLYEVVDPQAAAAAASNGKKHLSSLDTDHIVARHVQLSAQFDILRHGELCGHAIAAVSLSRGAQKAVVVTSTNEMVEVRCKLIMPTPEELAEAAESAPSAEGEEGAVPAAKGQLGDDLHAGPIIAGHFLTADSPNIVSSVAKLLSGSGFVTVGADRTVRLWQAIGEGDAVAGFKVAKVIKMDAPCTAVAVSNAALAVALYGGDNPARNGSVHLFSLPDGAFVAELPATTGKFVKDMKMSAEGNLIVLLRDDSSLEVFSQTEGQWTLRGTVQDSDSSVVESFDLSSDGLYVKVLLSNIQELRVFDINAGEAFGKELFSQLPAPSGPSETKEEGEESGPAPGAAQLELLRGLQWASQTIPHHWDSIGCAVLIDPSAISQRFDRFNHLLLSSGEDGFIQVSRLPCFTSSQVPLVRKFSAHAGALAALMFFDEGSTRILTVGLQDGIPRVWRVSYDSDEYEPDPVDVPKGAEEEKVVEEDEEGEGKVALPVLYDSGDEEDFEDGSQLRKHVVRNARRVDQAIGNLQQPSPDVDVGAFVARSAAERALSNFAASIDVAEGASGLTYSCATALNVDETSLTPSDDLSIDWVYGSTVRQTRNAVRYTSKGGILYPAGSLAVILDKNTKQQRYSFPHRDEITALDMHLNSGLVATSHKGVGDIQVFIWSSQDGSVVRCLNCGAQGGVSALKFSPCGRYLVVAIQNIEHSVLIFSVVEGLLLAQTPGSPYKILNVTFSEETYTPTTALTLRILQSGVKHFKLLSFNTLTRSLQSKTGIYGADGKKPNVLCSLAIPLVVAPGEAEGDVESDPSVTGPEFFLGLADGTIGTIQRGESKISGFSPILKGPITAIALAKASVAVTKAAGESEESANLPFKVVVGGCGGIIKILDPELQPLTEFNLYVNDYGLYPTGRVRGFKSFCVDKLARKILFATSAGEVGEIDLRTGQDLNSQRPLVHSHFKAQLRALATHPLRQECLTAGEDKTLRVWNLDTHTMTSIIEVPGPAVAACFAPNGHLIVASLSRKHSDPFGGRLTVLSYLQKETRIVYTANDAKEEIRSLVFSPDGSKVYAGSMDSCIYVYDALNNFKLIHTLQGHSEGVQSLDISQDGKFLISESVLQQPLLWELRGHSIISRPNEVREILAEIETRYYVRQNLLGLNSIGIFPPLQSMGSRENERETLQVMALSQSKDASLLATGDSHGLLSLYRNPAVSLNAPHKKFAAHSPGGLSKTAFTVDDRYLLSVGAQDKLLIQWSVKKSSSGPDAAPTSQHSQVPPERTFLESFTVRGVDFSPANGAQSSSALNDSAASMLQQLVGSQIGSSALAVQYCGQGELVMSSGKCIFTASGTGWQQRRLGLWNSSSFSSRGSDPCVSDVSAIAVSPCGRYVLAGFAAPSNSAAGSACPVYLFSAPTGELISVLKDDVSGGVEAAAFSKDGSLCAILGRDSHHSLNLFQSFTRDWSDATHLTTCAVSEQPTGLLNFLDTLALKAPVPIAASQTVPAAKDLAVSRPVSAVAHDKISQNLALKKIDQQSARTLSSYHFVTAGAGRIKFWRVDGCNVYSDNGMYCRESDQCEASEELLEITAVAAVGKWAATGDAQGRVYLWNGKYRERLVDQLSTSITAMSSFGQSLSTSHAETAPLTAGFVAATHHSVMVWQGQLASSPTAISAMCTTASSTGIEDVQLFCIANIDLQSVYSNLGWTSTLSMTTPPLVSGLSTDFAAREILLSLSDGQCLGVSTDSYRARRISQAANRVSQMAMHPELPHIAVTISEDAVLRVWDLSGESVLLPARETAAKRPERAGALVGFLALPHVATAVSFLHSELLLIGIAGTDTDGVSGSILTIEIKPSHSESDGDITATSAPFLLSVVHRFHNVGHGAIRQLRLNANKDMLASSNDDGCVYIHKVVQNAEGYVLEPVGNLLAHVDGSPVAAADFSADSRFVRVFGCNNLVTSEQRIETNFFDFKLDGGASAASMNPLKKLAAGKIQDVGALTALQSVSWASLGSPAAPEARGLSERSNGTILRTDSISVSPDGLFVAAGYQDGRVRVFRHPAPVAMSSDAALTLAVHAAGGVHVAFQQNMQGRYSLVTLGKSDGVFAVHSLEL